MRKIIQIAAAPPSNAYPDVYLIALCNDGTLWHFNFDNLRSSWDEIENVPQPQCSHISFDVGDFVRWDVDKYTWQITSLEDDAAEIRRGDDINCCNRKELVLTDSLTLVKKGTAA